MKLTFVNEIAALCEGVGADIDAVVRGIGLDPRIGRDFLRPGPGWGGSCFPKDSRALVSISAGHGYDFSIMRLVLQMNEVQKERIVQKIHRAAQCSDLAGHRVAILGLTFKAGTDDLRDSPSLDIIARLRSRGAEIAAYDPMISPRLSGTPDSGPLAGVAIARDAESACAGAHAVAVLTEWPEFKQLNLTSIAEQMAGRGLVDARNLLDPDVIRAAGLTYTGVGRIG